MMHSPVPSLNLTYHSLRYSFSIPAHLHKHAAESVERFSAGLLRPMEELSEEEPCSLTGLMTRYLEFLAAEIQKNDNIDETHRKYLDLILLEFEQQFNRDDIHVFAAALPDHQATRSSIKSYYHLKAAASSTFNAHGSILFNAACDGRAAIYTIFGGQGNNEHYFDELREVYQVYPSFVGELIDSSSKLLMTLSQDSRVEKLYTAGLDITRWLQDSQKTPDLSYLISCPVSFPIIGLTQLANYAVMCKALGKNPGEILNYLRGTTGHSQGIVVAAALASADSWQSFAQAAQNVLTILFWIGSRSQQFYPQSSMDPPSIQQSVDSGEGVPTPMLSVTDLPRIQLQQHVDSVNRCFPEHQKIVVALRNDHQNTVLAGPVQSLCGLNNKIRELKCPAGLDQTRIPFSKRKHRFNNRFLSITAPFHSEYLAEVSEVVIKDLEDIVLSSATLRLPVFGTESGEDLRKLDNTNIVPLLVRMIIEAPVDWRKATDFSGATHILDFGPGGTSGVGNFTHRAKHGAGVRVILATVLRGANPEIGSKSEIYGTKGPLTYGTNWLKLYGPKLAKTAAGTTFMEIKMSRALGLPPIMVAGMTPTTARWEFVAATMNAGYHIELAGGGFPNAKAMRDAIHNIQRTVGPGRGITINLIYASPRSMQWQLALIRQLRQDGVPIQGLTIGAGVPSLDVANEYIRGLGLSHIGFKPGSSEGIRSVLKIAKANPEFPIILQWTGGRGGGHHSFEDFHAPILQIYSEIRTCNNIILVAGSGFGGGSDTYPYISGSWSQKFGYSAMPFDGCLFGSRMMTAKEAHTSPAVKRAIAEAEGVHSDQWEQTYDGVAGGVITVRSEMGEPIHKLATRGVLFWAEMDRTIFSLDKAKRLVELSKKRAYIIKKLNDDFQKVWFAHSNGKAIDLEDMTYAEILHRLVELLYVRSSARWIDSSYRRLVLDFIRRVEERFMHSDMAASVFHDSSDLLNPFPAVEKILSICPEAQKQLINIEDVRYFLHICQRPGQKPVTFVPALDENFEVWFKKDSLWQSEDLEAVVGQDVGRCCILQGPVAVKHTKFIDEPIQQILDGINKTQIDFLARGLFRDDHQQLIPVTVSFDGSGLSSTGAADLEGLTSILGEDEIQYVLSSSATPEAGAWLALLAGRCGSWRHAVFTAENIMQDRRVLINPMQRMFKPRHDIQVRILHPNTPSKTIITLFETTTVHDPVPVVDIRLGMEDEVQVTMFAKAADGLPAKLSLKFDFHPENIYAPIHEIMEGRNSRIKVFYYHLWFGSKNFADEALLATQSRSRKLTISRKMISDFVNAASVSSEDFLYRPGKVMSAPMDLGIVICWQELIRPLFCIDGDLNLLVHLSNQFKILSRAETLREGDNVESTASITAILNQDSGKMVEVTAIIMRESMPVMEVKSKFLYRGTYSYYQDNFQRQVETPTMLILHSKRDLAVLRSKAWFRLQDSGESFSADLVGRTLLFKLRSLVEFRDRGVYRNIETSGKVFLKMSIGEDVQIGTVEYQSYVAQGNPVLDYLQRHGSLFNQPTILKNPIRLKGNAQLLLKIPPANERYAEASGDHNPIHTSRIFSELAGLPGTITHGMYSSTAVRNLVERWVQGNKTGCMRRFNVSFVGMVLPNTEIEVQMEHIGMIDGCKIISIDVRNSETKQKILLGEAEIELPTTTYFFTGQGSQEKNMGMELYAQSLVAREIWDEADSFFFDNYGKQKPEL